jgi:hypothetical protein
MNEQHAATPCINCICKPICKHKGFTQLIKDCSVLEKYLFITKQEKENFPLSEKEYWRRIKETNNELENTKLNNGVWYYPNYYRSTKHTNEKQVK